MKYKRLFSKTSVRAILLLTAVIMSAPSTYADENVDSFLDAFSEGEASIILRYRYEMVDQDNALEDASASTLKTRINFATKSWNDISFKFEVDNVSDFLATDFNSTANGKTNYSVVADPNGTDINQAWVQYAGISDTKIVYGRQRIVLDNQRFVGGVAWRQNEQTYDSFIISNNSIPDFTATIAYIWNVNRIFGPDGPRADIDADTYIFNAAYNGLPFGKLSFYGYLLDAQDAPNINTQTWGIRLAGKKLGGEKNWGYEVEYANQSDYDDRPTTLSTDYFHAMASYTVNSMTFGLGYEVLAADSTAGVAFATPLATLHKFNGWADQFLGTPADGLEDVYASFSTKLSNYKLTIVFHDFTAENSSNDYGSEFDVALVRKFSKNYSMVLKYASYSADVGKVDTDKLWLMFTASY